MRLRAQTTYIYTSKYAFLMIHCYLDAYQPKWSHAATILLHKFALWHQVYFHIIYQGYLHSLLRYWIYDTYLCLNMQR